MGEPTENPSPSRLILFQSEDRHSRIEVRLEGGTVWLTQAQMAELYQSSIPNINLHLKAIYEERELSEEATIKRYLIVREEGKRQVTREVMHYQPVDKDFDDAVKKLEQIRPRKSKPKPKDP